MIHLELAGVHTRLGSTLCAACPHGFAGCCHGPPDFGWSDVGRVVALGGRDWLLEEIARGRLTPRPHGLAVKRVRKREGPTTPRIVKCVYHGLSGCTIAPERRMAVCNYYLCASVYAEGGEDRGEPSALLARETHKTLMGHYARWDAEIAARIPEAFPWFKPEPEPEPDRTSNRAELWSAAFLDWLGDEFAARARST